MVNLTYSHFSRDAGVRVHVASRGEQTLGYIKEVFSDVFYVTRADLKQDSTRYRSIADAAASFDAPR